MRREYEHRGIKFYCIVNTMPGRRFRWSWETESGLKGSSEVLTTGVELAFTWASRAAIEAIDLAS